MKTLRRRQFLRNAALTSAAFTIVPRHVLGGARHVAPSDRVNVAGVGIGGIGRQNLAALSSQNLVAICDVDFDYVDRRFRAIPADVERTRERLKDAPPERAARTQASLEGLLKLHETYGNATRYVDWRKLLDQQTNIDALVVATPDHMHAAIALAAMDRGIHVYVQKPLAWSVEECRLLARRAASTGVVTQMGNQGHSSDDARLVNEYIQSGAIGKVREVEVWTDRPLAFWPQGIPRPKPLAPGATPPWNMNGVLERLAGALGTYAPPDKLAWDLFIGVSRHVDYHPVYHPFNWRGWTDWGVGAIGDMGAHLIDHAYWALDLGFPSTVETTSTPYNRDTYPMSSVTYYDFPKTRAREGVKLTWYDGGLTPPKPAELGEAEFDKGGGVLYHGTKGKLLHDTYGSNPRLLPKSLHESTGKPKERYARVGTTHEMNFIDAIRGNARATSPFEYAAKLTEVMLLGVAALNAGKKIEYDAQQMRIRNVSNSDALLKREYRKGWEIT
jgi:predicted dehydrogenase